MTKRYPFLQQRRASRRSGAKSRASKTTPFPGASQERYLANAAWKPRRTLAFEKAIMSKEIQDAPPADSVETQAAQQRVFRANLHDLFTCQAVREGRECGYQNSAPENQEAPANQRYPTENTILPNEPGTRETPAKENATP